MQNERAPKELTSLGDATSEARDLSSPRRDLGFVSLCHAGRAAKLYAKPIVPRVKKARDGARLVFQLGTVGK